MTRFWDGRTDRQTDGRTDGQSDCTPKKINFLTPGCFVLSLVIIGPMVLEKKIFTNCQHIFTISQIYPLWEGHDPSSEQNQIPFSQRCFEPSLDEIGLLVLGHQIFQSIQCIFTILKLSPLEKGFGSSFE